MQIVPWQVPFLSPPICIGRQLTNSLCSNAIQWNLEIKITNGQGQSGLNSEVVLIVNYSTSGV